MILGIDFDGTLVDHRFPDIGEEVPKAFDYLQQFLDEGARLILYTMRSDGQESGDVLMQAIDFCRDKGIEFWAHNENPEQHTWTTSNKPYCNLYIDDAALGCPLRDYPGFRRPAVDWEIVGPAVLKILRAVKSE